MNTKHKYQEEILNLCHRKHLTADDILEKMKKNNPEIGQATVYRTIKVLSEKHLLNKISGGDNKNYYEKADSLHGHTINESNEINDFDISRAFIDEMEKKVGKKIKGLDLKVYI